jgi:hypothetical protein
MTNENKIASMDAVGEDIGNLMLREFGYPHLPDPVFVPEKKVDAWNDAGTKPKKAGVYETLINGKSSYQYFDMRTFKFFGNTKEEALKTRHLGSVFQYVQWREVQP